MMSCVDGETAIDEVLMKIIIHDNDMAVRRSVREGECLFHCVSMVSYSVQRSRECYYKRITNQHATITRGSC